MHLLKAITLAACLGLPFLCVMAYVPVSFIFTDLPSHFQLYYLIASALLAVFVIILRFPATFILPLAVTAALSIGQLLPYLPFSGDASDAKPLLKILQTNTLYLNRETEALRNLIQEENPDIVVGTEINNDFAAMLASLKTAYPYQEIRASEGRPFGYAILSKKPFTGLEIKTYSNPAIPAVFFNIGGTRFGGLHPTIPTRKISSRDRDFAGIAETLKDEKSIVLLGDLNATPYCPALKKLVRDLGLRNAREGKGIMGSWPVWLPAAFRIPIDHALVSNDFSVIDHRLGARIGSDHLPTITVLGKK